jgi:predicted secreted Zn-dependent protease
MPNTKVTHYEVTGDTVTDINRSIARQRPRSTSGKAIPATTDWAVRAEFDRTITDGTCRVTAARTSFTASVDLPRLAKGARIDKPTRERWAIYVTELERGSLVTLAFVYQNLGAIEQAMLASDCETAKSVAAAAVKRLRAQTERLTADRERRLARQNVVLAQFQPGSLRAAKTVCRDLDVTGTRLQTVRACLPMREWERMQDDSEVFTRGVQDTRSQREPF